MVEVCKFAERVWDYGARRAWVIARGPGTDGEDMRGNLEILGRFWWARNTNSPPPSRLTTQAYARGYLGAG